MVAVIVVMIGDVTEPVSVSCIGRLFFPPPPFLSKMAAVVVVDAVIVNACKLLLLLEEDMSGVVFLFSIVLNKVSDG
jgi:hypothetical protein